MQFKFFVGIDVSKETLDFSILLEGKTVKDLCVENSSKGVKSALKELKSLDKLWLEKTLFCMEHTGIYNNHVSSVLHSINAYIWIEKAIHIKRSSGLQRGKSDKIDAKRIALFAYRNQDQVRLWQPARVIIQQLKRLTAVRHRLLLAVVQLEKPIHEAKIFDSKMVYNAIKSSCSKAIQAIRTDIKDVENKIKALIKEDTSLNHLFELVTSVEGIGPVIACEMIITTNEFKSIIDPKKYACYSGVVPFEHTSGSSIKGRNRVSNFANKNVKRLLHLAALSVIRFEGEFRTYYLRKQAEGKHKMVILNAIRNKLIHRAFAVVNRGSKYEKTYVNNLFVS